MGAKSSERRVILVSRAFLGLAAIEGAIGPSFCLAIERLFPYAKLARARIQLRASQSGDK
jgi:hypothetical protein